MIVSLEEFARTFHSMFIKDRDHTFESIHFLGLSLSGPEIVLFISTSFTEFSIFPFTFQVFTSVCLFDLN
jgi:hypothetical protein